MIAAGEPDPLPALAHELPTLPPPPTTVHDGTGLAVSEDEHGGCGQGSSAAAAARRDLAAPEAAMEIEFPFWLITVRDGVCTISEYKAVSGSKFHDDIIQGGYI